MKAQQFLEHHGIERNPFADEDAQTDLVFKDHCISTTYHPAWDKVYGDPAEPATSVVFGEKGSGKTAMRLQIARQLAEYNDEHPDQRRYVMHYDDFNPFLDRFRSRYARRKRADRVLKEWQLWDHMDAILSIGVTGLVDRVLEVRQPSHAVVARIEQTRVNDLDRHQARDLLLLAACYDQSTAQTFKGRWEELRSRLGFRSLMAFKSLAIGIGWFVIALIIVITMYRNEWWLPPWYFCLLFIFGGFAPWVKRFWDHWSLARAITNKVRVGHHDSTALRQVLMTFSKPELDGQPTPSKDRTDDRYELLFKFQGIIETLGFTGIVVLVDRIDEPHLINGSAELMKVVLWPMLDNKFLKHPGLGLKMMLPIELTRYVEREDREFYQRARLDKQNMISSFGWTGEALYDVVDSRIHACSDNGSGAGVRDLFEETMTDQRLFEALRSLRVPRHVFKFMYRLLVAHCNAHTDREPSWKINSETFESELALYQRDQDNFDRGLGAG